jgi:hypothetical protein
MSVGLLTFEVHGLPLFGRVGTHEFWKKMLPFHPSCESRQSEAK